MKTNHEIETWIRRADHYAKLSGEHTAPSSQLACLILADGCVYASSGDRGGPTPEMIRLAESILGVSPCALQLDVAQVDRALPPGVQKLETALRDMTCLCDKAQHDRDFFRRQADVALRKERELETELRDITSLCLKAQHDRDFFRTQAEERGRELREALSKAEEIRARTEQNNKALEKIIGPVTVSHGAAAAEAAASPAPRKQQRAGLSPQEKPQRAGLSTGRSRSSTAPSRKKA